VPVPPPAEPPTAEALAARYAELFARDTAIAAAGKKWEQP